MRRFANRIVSLFSVVILSGGYLFAQTVAISPGYVNLPLGGTQQYKATVTGLSPSTVTWSVTAGGGSITQAGLYTAPSTLPKNSVLVSATSTANRKISAVVYVNPEGSGPAITAISPNPAPVGNDTVTLTANASAPFIKGATAVCNGAEASAKFISSTSVSVAIYVGASPSMLTCYVNNPGTWQSNSLTVPVKGSTSSGTGPSTPAPVVSPASATVGLGGTQQFSASNVTTWSAAAGSISSVGLYTAPATATATGQDTVTATGPGGTSTATVTLVPKLVVSPSAVTVTLGATQQFTASNVTVWSAALGSVNSAGLYTAPTSMPSSGTDTITATGPGGAGTAIVTLQNYPAPSITSLSPVALPLGSFTAMIAGTGFTAQSTATLGGTPLIVTAEAATSLAVSGFASTTGMVNLIVSNGSSASAPIAVQVGSPNALVSSAAARRFLEQAAFGPTPSDAANVQTLGFQSWLAQQFAMPQVSNYSAQLSSSQGGVPGQFLANAVTNPDQLRQRVASR